MHDCQEMIFHFAVDYGSRDGVTVLVRQEIQIADDIPRGVPGLHEFWAVVMPHMEISEVLYSVRGSPVLRYQCEYHPKYLGDP